jgi:hypothetical protein
MSDTLRSQIEALAGELGATAARIEKALQQKFDLLAAELRAECSDLRAKAAEWELRAVNAERASADMVSARLATVRDGEPGRSVTLEDVAPMIRAEVERVVTAIPVPKDGAPGRDGVDGMSGKDGTPGRDGADGRDGVDGKDGQAGEQGPPGRDGVDGKDGESVNREEVLAMVRDIVGTIPRPQDGQDADPAVIRSMVDEAVAGAVSALPPPAKGDPGPPGRLSAVKAWTDRVYYDGDIVTLDGSTFQAIRDTGRQPPHDDWVCVAQAGRAGVDGRSFAIRGTWEPDGLYRELDVVAMNGASFVAKSDDPGPCPGDGWQLMSAQGKRGKPGDPGLKGNVGPKGPAVIGLGIDENGIQTLRNADGTTVSCDFYPLLSRLDR